MNRTIATSIASAATTAAIASAAATAAIAATATSARTFGGLVHANGTAVEPGVRISEKIQVRHGHFAQEEPPKETLQPIRLLLL